MTTPNPYTPAKETPATPAVPERPLDAWMRRGLTAVTLLPWLYVLRRAVLILLPTTALGHSWTPFLDVAVFASLLVGAVLVVARPRGARRSRCRLWNPYLETVTVLVRRPPMCCTILDLKAFGVVHHRSASGRLLRRQRPERVKRGHHCHHRTQASTPETGGPSAPGARFGRVSK